METRSVRSTQGNLIGCATAEVWLCLIAHTRHSDACAHSHTHAYGTRGVKWNGKVLCNQSLWLPLVTMFLRCHLADWVTNTKQSSRKMLFCQKTWKEFVIFSHKTSLIAEQLKHGVGFYILNVKCHWAPWVYFFIYLYIYLSIDWFTFPSSSPSDKRMKDSPKTRLFCKRCFPDISLTCGEKLCGKQNAQENLVVQSCPSWQKTQIYCLITFLTKCCFLDALRAWRFITYCFLCGAVYCNSLLVFHCFGSHYTWCKVSTVQ